MGSRLFIVGVPTAALGDQSHSPKRGTICSLPVNHQFREYVCSLIIIVIIIIIIITDCTSWKFSCSTASCVCRRWLPRQTDSENETVSSWTRQGCARALDTIRQSRRAGAANTGLVVAVADCRPPSRRRASVRDESCTTARQTSQPCSNDNCRSISQSRTAEGTRPATAVMHLALAPRRRVSTCSRRPAAPSSKQAIRCAMIGRRRPPERQDDSCVIYRAAIRREPRRTS